MVEDLRITPAVEIRRIIMGKVNGLYQNQVEAEYERGATDAYYGRPRNPNRNDTYKLESYLEGYEEEPYGTKDYGVDND
jgi:hypothetical protein